MDHTKNDKSIFILWDASHIWGLMALRAIKAFGLRCRLVKSKEIAQGALLGKLQQPAALLVPGGSARLKALALGDKGRDAIRSWVAAGGVYLGFCGGAGLALSQKNPADGLGLCPWTRAAYSHRIYHMLSGHVLAKESDKNILELPVWWPARFAPCPDGEVRILAEYIAPASDLWLSDIPLAHIPAHILKMWEQTRDVEPNLDFPSGQPLIIGGNYGKGKYILSYAHPETPQSPAANAWLAHMLPELCGLEPSASVAPAWEIYSPDTSRLQNPEWNNEPQKSMATLLEKTKSLLELGIRLRLFFHRTPWLLGWHAGMPGMAFNNLAAALFCARDAKAGPQGVALWEAEGKQFHNSACEFLELAEAFFWETRLEKTLDGAFPPALHCTDSREKQAALFGHPMLGGGFVQSLLTFVEDIIWLSRGS